MRHYLDYYFDLYWDLHLGVTGDDIPFEVREIGEAFNTVLAYRNPLLPITHDSYMKVRELLDLLKSWIDERIGDIQTGKIKNPEKTMAWYWLKNAGDGSTSARKTSSSSASTISSRSANGATRSSGSCRAWPKMAAIRACGRPFRRP